MVDRSTYWPSPDGQMAISDPESINMYSAKKFNVQFFFNVILHGNRDTHIDK